MSDVKVILISFGAFWAISKMMGQSQSKKEDASYTKPIEMCDQGVGGGPPVVVPKGPYAVSNTHRYLKGPGTTMRDLAMKRPKNSKSGGV